MSTVSLRRADPDDHLAVVRLFDAAMLETDADRLRRQLEATAGFVLLATIEERPVGAVAVDTEPAGVTQLVEGDPARITAIAVRPGRRGQGIGTELVAAVESRQGRVVAEFDPTVRPFWESVGFEVTERPESERLRGVRE
mgnify:CR=1 FL=1